ncbi:MAG: BLUF domain-containing protein [Kordiimonas sp.]
MLNRLVYVSEIRREHPVDIQEIVSSAAQFNLTRNVTGALRFDGDHFIQLLEGAASILSHIFDTRIIPATSHQNIKFLALKPCKERVFKDWSMAYLSENGHERDIAQKFMAEEGFNPRNCTADDIVNLLCFLEESRQRNAKEAIL